MIGAISIARHQVIVTGPRHALRVPRHVLDADEIQKFRRPQVALQFGVLLFFVQWIDRVTRAAQASRAWNTAIERDSVFTLLGRARAVYAAQAAAP